MIHLTFIHALHFYYRYLFLATREWRSEGYLHPPGLVIENVDVRLRVDWACVDPNRKYERKDLFLAEISQCLISCGWVDDFCGLGLRWCDLLIETQHWVGRTNSKQCGVPSCWSEWSWKEHGAMLTVQSHPWLPVSVGAITPFLPFCSSQIYQYS